MCIENDLMSIKKIFLDYPRKYKALKNELVKIEQERQDLLHVLELGKLNAIEQSKIARDLKSISVRRRKVKNNLEVLEVVNRFSINFNNNQSKDKQIETLTNTIKNITSRKRTYTMRVRTDLQNLVD